MQHDHVKCPLCQMEDPVQRCANRKAGKKCIVCRGKYYVPMAFAVEYELNDGLLRLSGVELQSMQKANGIQPITKREWMAERYGSSVYPRWLPKG